MKYVYIALFIPLLFLSGVYAGLEWGLSAKPTLDETKCQVVTRYEDNTLVCVPLLNQQPTPSPLEVGENTGMQKSLNTVQQTQDARQLQPAKGE